MFAVIGTVDNYTILPSPVLDDADPKGYRIEQRLQVTVKLAANERQQYTVEFRLGDDSQAPSTELLTRWLESGELVQAFCGGLAARPFVHSKEKTYQRRGRQVQLGDQTAELDAFVVFAGSAMAVLEPGSPLEEQVKQARAVFKRSQRAYRDQRNAARVRLAERRMAEALLALEEADLRGASAHEAAQLERVFVQERAFYERLFSGAP
jgi:hypothetical protein